MDNMRNLAGIKECDDFIYLELKKAGLEPKSVAANNGEVSYTIVGEVGDFTLTRAWTYWIAKVRHDNTGLPLDVAIAMHDAPYPDHMFDGTRKLGKYGNAIRVTGHCGCPRPEEWEENGLIKSYHIDTQEGLNEFVRRVNSLTRDDNEVDGAKLLYQACKDFVKKVDDNKAKSTKSYNQMKKAIEVFEMQQK